MHLNIDVERMVKVLLPDGVWHEVQEFSIGTYVYRRGEKTELNVKAVQAIADVAATWKEYIAEDGKTRILTCPITSIQAISCDSGD